MILLVKGKAGCELTSVKRNRVTLLAACVQLTQQASWERPELLVSTMGLWVWCWFCCAGVYFFPIGSDRKESTCNGRDLGSIPGLGRSLEKGTATHSSIPAWRLPWTEELCYSPWGHKESDTTEQLSLHFIFATVKEAVNCLVIEEKETTVLLNSRPEFCQWEYSQKNRNFIKP